MLCATLTHLKTIMYHSIFQTIKTAIVSVTGLERDALHIYVGLGVFLLTSLLFYGQRKRWFIAWLAAVAAATLGEVLDRRDQLALSHHWDWPASLHDLLNTGFWPTVLMLLLTYSRFFTNRERST